MIDLARKSSDATEIAQLDSRVRANDIELIAVYAHIPFCLSKCNYCDFNTYEGIESLMPAFVDALDKEIDIWGRRLGRREVSSVFFGGGTPSYLPSESISGLLAQIRTSYSVQDDAEITLEANPDDIDEAKAQDWLAAGLNRISIGVQAFNDQILASLSRRHSSDGASNAVNKARGAGFDNVNIDLMFGLPSQTITDWTETLNRALELDTEHLSLYGLQVEPGTPLHRDVGIGAVPTPDDDLAADMYEIAMDTLSRAGYDHYEISNWSKSGFRSQHNLTYWRNLPYLGVGPGAHSSLAGVRFANMKSPRRYVDTVETAWQSVGPFGDEVSTGEIAIDFVEETAPLTAMSETMMLGLRLADGVSKAEFESRFSQTMESVYGCEVEFLTRAGLLQDDGERISLTRRGKLLGNTVFERFVLIDGD